MRMYAGLLGLVTLASLAVVGQADTWVKVDNFVDANCTLLNMRSVYKADACYRQGNGFTVENVSIPISTSLKFSEDGVISTYETANCTGNATQVNDGTGACGGHFKVTRTKIPGEDAAGADGAFQTAALIDPDDVVVASFPNAPNASSCTELVRFDIFGALNESTPRFTQNLCYAGRDPFYKNNFSKTYVCDQGSFGKLATYMSYGREGNEKTNCIKTGGAALLLDVADGVCNGASVSGDAARYILGCGTTYTKMREYGLDPRPFKNTPWGWSSPPPPSPPPSPPPPSPPPPSPPPPSPPPPLPPPPPFPPPEVIVENNTKETVLTGALTGAALALVLILGYLYWRSQQRVIIKDMAHARKIMASLDKEGADEIDTADFCRALNMPMDVWANRLVRMLDPEATGFISFKGFVTGMAKFHDCAGTTGLNVGFRLMDADRKQSVSRSDLVNILRAVLPGVQKSKGRDAYSTRKVMTYMKTVTDPVTVADFQQLEKTFPGLFRGALETHKQFKSICVPCKELLDNDFVTEGQVPGATMWRMNSKRSSLPPL